VQPLAVHKRSDNHHQQAEWITVVERGNNVAKMKQWGKALQFYNRALDLIDNPIATPQAPSDVQIKKVLNLASQAQLLANSSEVGTRSILDCNTMMRSQVRGFQIKKHLIPVQFEFGKTTFSEKGKKSASQLAECLKQRQRNDGLSKVELVGHTDEKGSDEFNDKLSFKRAEFLRTFSFQIPLT
jgi:outer membrane protein OmpA-like peptidoglycan-associated protein